MTLAPGPGELRDPALAGVEHLTGRGAEPMLDAIAGAVGATAGDFSIAQISHDPAQSCTVSYAGSLHWADGTRTDETVVAVRSVDGPPEGASVLVADPDDPATPPFEVGVWRYPYDPALPGLASTVIPELATERHGDLVGGPVTPTVVGYRPGRRAVVRLDGPNGTVWAKVVRPSRAARLVALHDAAIDAGLPVPTVRRATGDVVVLSHLAGATLRDQVLDAHDVPPPVVLAPLLRRLATLDVDDRPARRRPLADVGVHVASLVATLPDHEARLVELLGRLDVERRGDELAIGAGGVVHGDLHDAQVLCDDAGVTGLLDLDDVGRGDRADDVANLIAHAATLATTFDATCGRAMRSWCVGTDDLVAALDLDPDEVARRAAAAALSLATGPLRACEPDWRAATLRRIDLAEALAAGPRQLRTREKSLRTTSRPTHPHAGEQGPSTDVATTSTPGGTT